ncbi:MAG: ankyrin repeat domain-containing protein [Halopseudomonas sp.]
MNRLLCLLISLLIGALSSPSVLAISACKKDGAIVYTKACLKELQQQNSQQSPIQSQAKPNPASEAAAIAAVKPQFNNALLTQSQQPPTAAKPIINSPATAAKCSFQQLAELVKSADKQTFLDCEVLPRQLNQQDDRKASSGRSLLHWAIASQQPEMAKLLLSMKVDPSQASRSDKGGHPIHLAAQSNQTELISLLLDRGADLDARDYFKRTPLHWAAEANRTDTCQQLLNAGANPNASDRIGKTPLMLSIGHSTAGVIEILISARADPKRVNLKGMTALHLATTHSSQAVKLLLRQGLDIDPMNNAGQTPLLFAASQNPQRYWPNIKLLIEQGADLNVVDNSAKSLLDYSLNHDHMPLFELLLDQGYDSDKIFLGQLRGKRAFIELLMNKGLL